MIQALMSVFFILRRALRITLGYAAAALAAAVVVLWLGYNTGRLPEMSAGALALWGATLAVVTGATALALWPALVALIAAEVLRLRQLWAYLLLGLAGGVLAHVLGLREELDLNDAPLMVALAAGAAAALAYWLTTGRTAGGHAPPPQPERGEG